MYTTLDSKCILSFTSAGFARSRTTKESAMRVWAFTVAVFLGLVTWGADLLDNNSLAGDQQTITDGGGGPDNGPVTVMDDPVGPPKP